MMHRRACNDFVRRVCVFVCGVRVCVLCECFCVVCVFVCGVRVALMTIYSFRVPVTHACGLNFFIL